MLFLSSSVGLGHIVRDVYLAGKMDFADIEWVTSGNALRYIEARDLKIHPVSYELRSLGRLVSGFFRDAELRMGFRDAYKAYKVIKSNSVKVYEEVDFEIYDAIISDEFWELLFIDCIHVKKIFITDFTKFKPRYGVLWEPISYWFLNRGWRSRVIKYDKRIYVGLHEYSGDLYDYHGVLPSREIDSAKNAEDVDEYILVNLGGTDAGASIQTLFNQLKEYSAIIVGGETSFDPDPWEKIIRASLIVCLAGYSSLLEVALLNKPAIIVPLRGHFEHEDNARIFRGRRGYRVYYYRDLLSLNLSNIIEDVLMEEPNPPRFRIGTQYIVESIKKVLEGG